MSTEYSKRAEGRQGLVPEGLCCTAGSGCPVWWEPELRRAPVEAEAGTDKPCVSFSNPGSVTFLLFSYVPSSSVHTFYFHFSFFSLFTVMTHTEALCSKEHEFWIVNTCYIKKYLASFLCSCFPDSEGLRRVVCVLKEAIFGSIYF